MCEAKCRFDHCLPRLRAAPFIATSAVQHSALIRPVYGRFAASGVRTERIGVRGLSASASIGFADGPRPQVYCHCESAD